MRQERNDFVDPLTVRRWATKRLQVLAAVFWPSKQVVGESWRMDETCIKVDGQWRYIYRAVDGAGDTVDFLITSKRHKTATRCHLARVISLHGVPEKITTHKSGAHSAAIESGKADVCVHIVMRPNKYLSNHRGTSSPSRPKNHRTDARVQVALGRLTPVAGTEAMHMISKEQMNCTSYKNLTIPDCAVIVNRQAEFNKSDTKLNIET